jgi:hypothetical protein
MTPNAMRRDNRTAHKMRNIERNPAREARSFNELPWASPVPDVTDSTRYRYREPKKLSVTNSEFNEEKCKVTLLYSSSSFGGSGRRMKAER